MVCRYIVNAYRVLICDCFRRRAKLVPHTWMDGRRVQMKKLFQTAGAVGRDTNDAAWLNVLPRGQTPLSRCGYRRVVSIHRRHLCDVGVYLISYGLLTLLSASGVQCEMNEEHENSIEFVESGEDTAKALQAAKQQFNLVALLVDLLSVFPNAQAIALGRYDGKHLQFQHQLPRFIAGARPIKVRRKLVVSLTAPMDPFQDRHNGATLGSP